jgi:ribosome maturation factor RimP
MMVGRPDLVTEAMQFIQDLYRNVPEERMHELLSPEHGVEGEAVFYTKDYFEKFKGREVRVELKTGAVIKGVIKEAGESTLTVECTEGPCIGEELVPLNMVRKIWE